MSSTAAAPLMKTLKIVIFSILFVSAACVGARYTLPHLRERNAAVKKLDEINRDNAVLDQKIAQLRKNRTEFQNNNLDFIILTGHREGLIGPNEKLFEFTEPVAQRVQQQK